MNFFHGYQHGMFYTKKHVYAIQDARSCEYTQPPWAFTQTWATSRVRRVDMLYLGAYTAGGCLFRIGVISGFYGSAFLSQNSKIL